MGGRTCRMMRPRTRWRRFQRFANRQATLISASGDGVALPTQLFEVLARVPTESAAGRGVTVMPRDMRLTTQQAADLLAVSRPTLIRLLENGQIPLDLVGRHRRILLRDVERYQEQSRTERRALLRQFAREGQQDGLHNSSCGPQPSKPSVDRGFTPWLRRASIP